MDWYALSIEGLFNAFVKAVRAYEAELKRSYKVRMASNAKLGARTDSARSRLGAPR